MNRLVTLIGALGILVGCSDIAPPDQPPELTAPPPVATSGFITAYTEQVIPMSLPDLREFMLERPIVTFLEPTGNISKPVEFETLVGTWGEVGATRRVKLADGHYAIERITRNDPGAFDYQIFVFTNAAGRGVDQIVGEQRFVPVDGGTRFEWSYKVLPKHFIARQVIRGNMDAIEGFIAGGLERFTVAATEASG